LWVLVCLGLAFDCAFACLAFLAGLTAAAARHGACQQGRRARQACGSHSGRVRDSRCGGEPYLPWPRCAINHSRVGLVPWFSRGHSRLHTRSSGATSARWRAGHCCGAA
jgi:hypothetical protein